MPSPAGNTSDQFQARRADGRRALLRQPSQSRAPCLSKNTSFQRFCARNAPVRIKSSSLEVYRENEREPFGESRAKYLSAVCKKSKMRDAVLNSVSSSVKITAVGNTFKRTRSTSYTRPHPDQMQIGSFFKNRLSQVKISKPA